MKSWEKHSMEADAPRVLASNLEALARRHPGLAQAIRESDTDTRIGIARARTGALVPLVRIRSRGVPLHSLYDPLAEARKAVATLPETGCVVTYGLGAGHLVSALLERPDVALVFIVEKDASTLRSLLALFPLERLLCDPRVTLCAGTEAIHARLPSAWLPALMGNLGTMPLRAWCDIDPSFLERAASEVQKGINAARADYAVQAHFGKRWHTNILLNLERMGCCNRHIPEVGSACITAAGPSLDENFANVAAEKGSSFIVATDTSLPALRGAGIEPDAVLSIDCQNHSCHHFMHGAPENALVVFDAASPPCLARRYPHAAFVRSNHPLLSYFAVRGLTLPLLDMSGGNVTHAAMSLGRSLGAARVSLFGADFSYPDGKPYARGTYLYDFFGCRQGRLAPLESQFAAFLFRSPGISRQSVEGTHLYTTPILTAYRDKLVEMIGALDAEVMPAAGHGLPLPSIRRAHLEAGPHPSGSRRDPAWEQAGMKSDWKGLLAGYARGLEDLAQIPAKPGPSFHSLSTAQAELVLTLLPVAASMRRENGGDAGSGAVEEARVWALQRTRRLLE
jgi:hypothetical protein